MKFHFARAIQSPSEARWSSGGSQNKSSQISEKASTITPWYNRELRDKKHCNSSSKSLVSKICFSNIISSIDLLKSSYGSSVRFTTAKLSLTFVPCTVRAIIRRNADALAEMDSHLLSPLLAFFTLSISFSVDFPLTVSTELMKSWDQSFEKLVEEWIRVSLSSSSSQSLQNTLVRISLLRFLSPSSQNLLWFGPWASFFHVYAGDDTVLFKYRVVVDDLDRLPQPTDTVFVDTWRL